MTIDELQRKITAEQAILAQYEEQHSLEGDPRRRAQKQAEIDRSKIYILGLQTHLATLRRDHPPTRPTQLAPQPATLLTNAPYGLEDTMVGRTDERLILDDWLLQDPDHPFMAVIGLGGQGKSALTWDWMNQKRQAAQTPPLIVWWGFYETDGTLDQLTERLLPHFNDDPQQYPSLRAKIDRLLDHLQHTPILLMLDGAERLLRAYSGLGAAYQGDGDTTLSATARQCTAPVAGRFLQSLATPGFTQAKTLFTSRLFPQDLEGRSGGTLAGVRRHDLTGLTPEATHHLFTALNIPCTRAEVTAVAEPLGYHPLSLRLLARRIAYDPATPNDLSAAAGYDPTSDLLGKRQHVLTAAYDSLPPSAQTLLSRLAAFRSTVNREIMQAIFGNDTLRDDLELLEKRGLLQRTIYHTQHSTQTLYDLHPIVRRYAYGRLNNPTYIHTQLITYFEAMPWPETVTTLADLQPTIELYHHFIRAGKYDEAFELFGDRLTDLLYYQLGAYQKVIELLRQLLPDRETQPSRLSRESDQTWTLNELGNSYSLAGQPTVAIHFCLQHNDLLEMHSDKMSLTRGLVSLAYPQLHIGQLTAATSNLRHQIIIAQGIEDQFIEAVGHQAYGLLLAIVGQWQEAKAELNTALEQFTNLGEISSQGIVWAYHAQTSLLWGEPKAGLSAAQEALHLAEETACTDYTFERDFIRAHWLLGWATLTAQDLPTAQHHLDEALRRCRAINLVVEEPAILLAHARLAHARGQAQESKAWAEEALQIAERAGYVLDLADIHNHLAQLALDAADLPTAHHHAQTAHDYAWCDGPPYAYQPALDQANRLLEEIKKMA